MPAKGQHVVPNLQGGWSVRQTRSSRASRVFSNQAEAVQYARERATKERAELYVHGRDGTVRERGTYGGDPIRAVARRPHG